VLADAERKRWNNLKEFSVIPQRIGLESSWSKKAAKTEFNSPTIRVYHQK
jgi:hypothetical protein